jgi:hypothetical protein
VIDESDRDGASAAASESGRLPYEPPAIILERRIEAVANTCAFDPPLTKSNAGEGCTGLTFS